MQPLSLWLRGCGSDQCVATILNRPGDFDHSIRTRNFVFEFDRRLHVPPIVPDQSEDFHDRRVALAERGGVYWEIASEIHSLALAATE